MKREKLGDEIRAGRNVKGEERREGKKKEKKREPLALLCGRTMKAPPPADSTMMARNLGFTAQNVESHDDLDTLILS